MKYPMTMGSAVFYIDWESYPNKPERTEEDMEDGLGFYGPDHLDDCWNELNELPWVEKLIDPMGAQKTLLVFVSVSELPKSKDLFWAEGEIIRVFRKNRIELNLPQRSLS